MHPSTGSVSSDAQRFVVENSEQTRERPYIGREIEATLDAYGLKDLPSPQDLGAAPTRRG